ncbi:hypothetical protein E5D57_008060 [Metarhizium anisopliae]|nr:hypothetical protein E5D57_008060 [Metarhizium anisopliae]
MDDSYDGCARLDAAEPGPELNQGIEEPVEIFRKYLTSEWTRKKTPYGLDAALAKAADSESDATERVFLSTGFTAWLAYFLASTGEGHYEGRYAQLQAIAAFNQLPVEERKAAAKRVAETVPHDTVRHAIGKMLQEPKRRRELPIYFYIPSLTRESGLLSPTGDHESRIQSYSTSPTHSISSSAGLLPSPTQQDTTANLDNSQTDISLTSDLQQQVLSHASLQGTADIFPEYMSGAIRRDLMESDGSSCWRAAVTMTFPYLGKVDCLMSLAIRETKVEHSAMALFNVHVDVESAVQARQVVLQHGVRLTPNPEITLQGVRDEAIQNLLGLEIYEAIKSSRVFQEELQQGTRATRCVSMIIPGNPNIGAVINLNLGLKEGSRIRNKLYRRFASKDKPV